MAANWRTVTQAIEKKRMKIASRILLVLAVVAVLSFALCSYLTTRGAEQFMAAVRQLEVGTSDTAHILAIAQRFRSNVTTKSAVCDVENCSVKFAFQNPLLKLLRLPTLSRLDAMLRIDNHAVGYVYIAFGMGGGAKPVSVVNVMEFADSVPGGVRLDILPRANHGVPRIFVRLDKHASDSEKQSSFDLNLSCLNQPFKCRDAYDLAPSLPQRPEARSLLPNTS